MSRLWKKDWFKYLLMGTVTMAVIVAAAFITEPQYVKNEAVLTEPDETEQDTAEGISEPYLPAGEFNAQGESIAAKWVNGQAVPMTSEEIAEFEAKLYSCRSGEEYRALLESVVYYNKYIDTGRLYWYRKQQDN